MEEYIKTKKMCKITSIIMAILSGVAFIAGLTLELLSETENEVAQIPFLCSFVCLVISILVFIFCYKLNSKSIKKIVDQVNQEIDEKFTYVENVPISDLIKDSMFPCKNQAIALDGIVGKFDDVSFEYYLTRFYDDDFFPSSFKKTAFEFYVFKDVSIFHKQFFVTDLNIKNASDYKILPTDGTARIYTMKEEEFPFLPLPEGVIFLSVQARTLYMVKTFSRKKPLFLEAKSLEEVKENFLQEIEKIKKTFEEAEYWIS